MTEQEVKILYIMIYKQYIEEYKKEIDLYKEKINKNLNDIETYDNKIIDIESGKVLK